jgi:hypothetical protein
MCVLQHHVFNFMENTVKLKVAAGFDSFTATTILYIYL